MDGGCEQPPVPLERSGTLAFCPLPGPRRLTLYFMIAETKDGCKVLGLLVPKICTSRFRCFLPIKWFTVYMNQGDTPRKCQFLQTRIDYQLSIIIFHHSFQASCKYQLAKSWGFSSSNANHACSKFRTSALVGILNSTGHKDCSSPR